MTVQIEETEQVWLAWKNGRDKASSLAMLRKGFMLQNAGKSRSAKRAILKKSQNSSTAM